LNHRQSIHHELASLLGEEVKISERVFQSLEVTSRKGGIPDIRAVWAKMERIFPAINQVYETIGLNMAEVEKYMLKFPSNYDDSVHQFTNSDWQKMLKSIFTHSKLNEKSIILNKYALEAKKKKSIDLDDLFKIIITNKRIANRKYRNASLREYEVTNLVIRNLHVALGFERKQIYDSAIEGLSNSLIRAFEFVKKQDLSFSDQQFILYHDTDKIRIQPFAFFGTNHLIADDSKGLFLGRSDIIQKNNQYSLESIDELEYLINKNALEADFQNFFERNPKYLLTLGDYSNIHSQIVLHKDHGSNLIPDFFLEKMNSDFCDILDLKRAQKELIRIQKNRIRFKDAVMEGVAQLRTYRDYFEEKYNRNKFHSTYGLKSYRPKVVLIIGRKQSYFDEVEKIRIESELPEYLTLKTYDDIVERAKYWNKAY